MPTRSHSRPDSARTVWTENGRVRIYVPDLDPIHNPLPPLENTLASRIECSTSCMLASLHTCMHTVTSASFVSRYR